MRNLIFYYTISVLTLLCMIEKVSAILCWECTSRLDPRCADPFDNSTAIMIDCEHKRKPHLNLKSTMCRKIRQKVNGQWRFLRGCAWLGEPGIDGDERYCLLRTGTWDIHIEYCQCNSKDGCNDAVKYKPTSLVVWFVIFAALFVRW